MPTRYALLLLLLAGCATASRGPVTSAPSSDLVLNVHSESDRLAVYLLESGTRARIGTVQPGQRAVIRIHRRLSGTVRLIAESQHGRGDFVADWSPEASACWTWALPRVGYRVGDRSRWPVPCERPREDPALSESQLGGWVNTVLNEDWLGFVSCGQVPRAWVRADVVLSPEGPAAVVHELAHVSTIHAAGGCAAFEARYQADPRVLVALEATAFCASAKVWSKQEKVPLAAAVWRYAEWLSAGYPFDLSPEAAAREIAAAGCSS